MPWIRKHGTDPVTGSKLASSDLIKLNFFKNPQDEYYDPVSYKVFNEHTAIAAISSSGNVFSKDTIDSLNIKAGFWRDLVDDTSFTRKHIIVLQDPHNLERRDLSKFHYIKSGLGKDSEASTDKESVNVAAMGNAGKVLAQLADAHVKDANELPLSKKSVETLEAMSTAKSPRATIIDIKKQMAGKVSSTPYNAANFTTGKTSASLTSTSVDVNTRSDRALIDEEQWMFERILPGERGYVAVNTNFGVLNVELFCDRAPRTCYNFLMLSRQGKYDNTIFHRHIPGFMLQGGDPTGTGNGGESYWGRDFSDEHSVRNAYKHESRGMLSMANRGANTNSSQFFFTFRATPHLNGKHTVFGKIVGGEDVLRKIESVAPNPATDRPTRQIRIVDVAIYKDPFDDFKSKLAKRLARDQDDKDASGAKARAKEEREKDRTTWFGTQLGEKGDSTLGKRELQSNAIGRYMSSGDRNTFASAQSLDSNDIAEASLPAKKAKRQDGGFGNFEGW